MAFFLVIIDVVETVLLFPSYTADQPVSMISRNVMLDRRKCVYNTLDTIIFRPINM